MMKRRVAGCLVALGIGGVILAGGRGGAALAQGPEVRTEAYRWKNVVIEGGGFVSGVVMHPKVKGLTYVRTDIGGAYRRNSPEEPWVPLTDWVGMDNVNLLGCESVAVDPSDANRVYLALGTYVAKWSHNGAIARSADQGKHFQLTMMPFQMGGNNPGRTVGERLAVDPNDGRILFFGSRTVGLWRSEDYGATWSKVTGFPAAAEKAAPFGISFVTFDGETGKKGAATPTIYAGICTTGESLFRSEDGGRNWTAVAGAPTGVMPIHGVISADRKMYLSYGNPPGPEQMTEGAVWRLDLGSGAWKEISPVKPGGNGGGGGKDRFGYGGIAVSATDPRIVMTSTFCRWSVGDSVFRSDDGGETWREMRMRDPDPNKVVLDPGTAPYAGSVAPHWMSTVVIDPFDSNHATFVTGFGMWSTMDAGNAEKGKPVHWRFDNRGLEETADLELKSPPVGAHLVSAIGDYDGFRHDDLEHSPARGRFAPSVGTTRGLDFAGQKPLMFIRCGADGKGFVSTDGAATWKAMAGHPADAQSPGKMALSADGKEMEWSTGGGRGKEWYSRDGGAAWKECEGVPEGAEVLSDRVMGGRFYAFDRREGELYRSDDGAAHFAREGTRLPAGRIFVSPAGTGDVWFASDQKGIFHSTDGGHTFAPVPGMARCWTLGFGKAAPGEAYPALYAVGEVIGGEGGVKGVFRSDDSGKNWVRINDDQHQYGWIGETVIGDPRVYGRVYLGTNGRGILYADPVGTADSTEREAAGR